jgi:hypothetical protein
MIIKSGDQSILKRLPFTARFNEEEMTVSFSEGFIIDCYSDNFSGNEMKQGSTIYRPINMDDEFQVESGDSFYLEIKENLAESNIFKVSRQTRRAFEEEGVELKKNVKDVIPIWFSKTQKEPSRQFLTENVFLQDIKKSRKWGFQLKKGETKNGETEYILYGGFLMCPNQGYSKFHKTETFKVGQDEEIFLYIEIDVSAEVSNINELQKSDTVEIKSVRVTDSRIIKRSEELSEDDIFKGKIRMSGGKLNKTQGKYYISLPRKGNVEAYFSALDPDVARIEPLLYTQVKGEKGYKNGVSTVLAGQGLINAISEDEQGHYQSITIVETYPKLIIREEEDDAGNIVSFVEENGTHDITTEYYVEEGPAFSELEPIVLVNVDEPELGEDEFYIRPKIDDEYSFGGGEISRAAYGEVRGRVSDMDFVNIGRWTGDSTAVLFGAGKDGVENKTLPTVIHAERQYKKIGQISLSTGKELLDKPDSFKHYGLLLDTEGDYVDDVKTITYDENDGVYTSKEWTEIEIKDDGVYTKELLYSECDVQEYFGEYHNIEFTKEAFDYYQELIMSTS